jgi:protein phosphatase
MPATFATATHTGLVRKSNEDALFARTPVFAVADGMGGAQAGEVASGMATQAFSWFIPQSKSPEAELTRLVSRVNQSIYELAVTDSSRSGMGTTLTAAVIQRGNVSLAHVGDSRAYLWRGGALSQLTVDHSLVGEMVRSGQITPAEAEDHPQRSIITRALGVDSEIEIDTRTLEWQPGDIFLLCSDGLYSMIADEAIASVLARADDLNSSALELVEAANAAGGRDNISVVLFSPDGSVPSGTEADLDSQMGETGPGEAEPPDLAETSAVAAESGRLAWLRRRFNTIPGRIVAGLALSAILLTGAWLITREVYYLGVEGDHVAIYRGIPYDLGPWSLASVYRHSSVKFSDLEPFEQERISRQELQTGSSAEKMLNNYITQANDRQKEADRQAAEEAAKAKAARTTTVPSGVVP